MMLVNKYMLNQLLYILAAAVLLTACRRQTNPPINRDVKQNPNEVAHPPTARDVKQNPNEVAYNAVKPNMSESEVMRLIGSPLGSNQIDNHRKIYYYAFFMNFPDIPPGQTYTSGIEVIFVDGKVNEVRRAYGFKAR
jgi:hypothetical protein